ncbi:MAG TPA: hypothetical protein VK611_20265 [Acidimicrobiales bacterium]|nr:hypothetical protein [Acidimicrobiales bacterium]
MASNHCDPVERAAALRQARIDVKTRTTFELRWRCRTLKRKLGDLDGVGHAQLRAVVEELRARREAVPA